MKKKLINVPENIHYLSDWKELKDLLPMNTHFILNKKICGCGATEAFLRSSDKVILASPRKHLLYNKYSQHLNDNFHLYRWIDDINAYFKGSRSVKNIKTYNNNLIEYINLGGKKILTTYDSIDNVVSCLISAGDNLQSWTIVVDEFQSMFGDSFYKSDVEYSFNKTLDRFESVIYLSATPFLEKYLDMVDTFKNLTLIELNWPESSIEKTCVDLVKTNKSFVEICQDITKKYKSGQGHYEIIDGKIVKSEEAVLYLNNVKDIASLIRRCKLSPDEVNIICSNTPKNLRTIKKLGSKFDIGSIPGKGEPHRMFTFCTSTVYIGADFYSESAYSYIFATPLINSMAVDISVDLQQILGRERLESNPFRNKATMFYVTKVGESKEEAKKEFENKLKMTQELIKTFENISKEAISSMFRMFRADITLNGHASHFCSVYSDNNGNLKLVKNEILMAADLRAWEVINKIYNNDFVLYQSIKASNNFKNVTNNYYTNNDKVKKIYAEWTKDNKFDRKAKLYCDLYDKDPDLLDECTFIERRFREYHQRIGRKGFEDLQWRESYIKHSIEATKAQFNSVHSEFQEISYKMFDKFGDGKFHTNSEIKTALSEIYKKLSLDISPKASDILKYSGCFASHKVIGGKSCYAIRIDSKYRNKVSVFQNITHPEKSQTWNIDDVLTAIRVGSNQLKPKVEEIRNGKDKEKAKLKLPAVCYSGVFTKKCKDSLDSYSSFLALDFDDIKDSTRMKEIKEKLKTIPYIYAYFTSPSGNGLKVIILHNNFNSFLHETLYNQVVKKFIDDFPEIDTCTKDLARGNFMSYDPDLWRNDNPEPYNFVQQEEKDILKEENEDKEIQEKDENTYSAKFLSRLRESLVSDEYILRTFKKRWKVCTDEGERNNKSLAYASVLCRSGISKQEALQFIQRLFPGYDVTERVNYAYSHNTLGSDRIKFIKRRV